MNIIMSFLKVIISIIGILLFNLEHMLQAIDS